MGLRVTPPPTGPTKGGRVTRSVVLKRLFGEAEAPLASDGWIRAVATFLVDAIAQPDLATVQVAADGLRETAFRATDERAEALLLGMLEVAHVAIRQLQSEAAAYLVEPRSLAARFVTAVGRHPGISNAILTDMLDVDETQVSRAGRRLWDLGLAVKRRVGRQNAWVLTPAGRALAKKLDVPESTGQASEPPIPRARIWNAPPRNERFLPPKDILEILEAVPEQGLVRQVITGFAGVGKSQVAAEFIHRNADHYQVVWWVRGSSLLADFAELAEQLSLPGRASPDLRAVAGEARRWLEATTDTWLLVVDGANDRDEVNRLVPASGSGRVLVTSRSLIWGDEWQEHSLGSLSKADSHALIVNGLPSSLWTDNDVAALVELVEHQPLALRQAADFIREREITVRTYLDRLGHQEPRLMEMTRDPRPSHDLVGITSDLCFMAVQDDSPVAAELMSVLVFLGPDKMLTEDMEHISEIMSEPGMIEDALHRLSVYDLADTTGQAVMVHPLVQKGLSQRMDHVTRQRGIASAVRLMQGRLPAVTSAPESWPLCERLFPHAIAAADHVDSTADRATLAAASDIFARLADYSQARVRFPTAQRFSERAMQMAEIAFGPESIEVAKRLRRHGEILRDLGDIANAEIHLTRAVRLAHEHFDVRERFDTESSLGSLLREKGDFIEALKKHEEALGVVDEDRESVLVDEDRKSVLSELDGAIACANLARAQHALGELDNSWQNFEAALFLKKKWAMEQPGGEGASWDDEALRTKIPIGPVRGKIESARTIIDFAAVLLEAGELDAAEHHLHDALEVLITHLGAADPFVARAHVCLGTLYRQQGLIDKARDYLQKGLDETNACFGPEHYEVGRALLRRGFLLWDCDDFQGARDDFERSYKVIEHSLGPFHPDAARALSGWALVLQDSGDLARAHEYHKRALEIFRKAYGPMHFEVAGALDRLGYTVAQLGEIEGALTLHEQALDIIDRVLGDRRRPDQRLRYIPLVNIARAFRELDDQIRAKDRAVEALALIRSNDRDAGIARMVLGQIERDRHRYADANEQFQLALRSFLEHFGSSHRDVAAAWRNIGVTDFALGNLPAAKSNIERSIAILKELKSIDPRELREATEDLAVVERRLGLPTVMPTPMRDRVGGLALAGV